MSTESHNQRQIERLNQRGGRALSIIDLIEDDTLTAEMAALCFQAVRGGAPFLTGAVPGGAGKTTLMAAVLAFLPPEERIVTVADRSAIDSALAGRLPAPATLLAHEIGAGHWFGYIWGRDAADFFRAAAQQRPVTCLHADTPGQAWGILEPLGVAREDFGAIRLQLFMHVAMRAGRVLRRMSRLCLHADGGLLPAYEWRESGDRFERVMPRDEICAALAEAAGTTAEEEDAAWRERLSLLESLQRDGLFLYEDVRARALASE